MPEASERVGADEIRVPVLLEGDTSISAVAVAFLDEKVGAYTVVGWEVGSSLDGRSLLKPVTEKSPTREWILTGVNLEMENTRSLEMGVLVLAPSSETGLLAATPVEGDFHLLAGEIMTAEGDCRSPCGSWWRRSDSRPIARESNASSRIPSTRR